MKSRRIRIITSVSCTLPAITIVICGFVTSPIVSLSQAKTPVNNSSGSPITTVSGLIVADKQATLSTRMPARIVSVFANENSAIKRGKVAVQLDDSDLRSQAASAAAAVKGAKALEAKAVAGRDAQAVKSASDIITAQHAVTEARTKLAQAVLAKNAAVAENAADLKSALQGVKKAQIAFDRAAKTVTDLEKLDSIGGVSRNDLEGARTQATLAQQDLDSANAAVNRAKDGPKNGPINVPFKVALAASDVETASQGLKQAEDGLITARTAAKSTNTVGNKDVLAAHASVLQAQAGLAGAMDAIRSMRLVAPFDGMVTSVNAHVGEVAQPGLPLLSMVSLSNIRVEALVPARSISGLRVGMHVSVYVDTLAGHSLDAVVSDIAHIAETDGRSIKVRFRLIGNPGVRPGLSARVSFSR